MSMKEPDLIATEHIGLPLTIEALIKDNVVLLDVNERARSYSDRTHRFALTVEVLPLCSDQT